MTSGSTPILILGLSMHPSSVDASVTGCFNADAVQIGRQVVGCLKDPSNEVPKLTFHGSFTTRKQCCRKMMFSQTFVCPSGVGYLWYPPLLTASGGHQSGRYASYWNAFSSSVLVLVPVGCMLPPCQLTTGCQYQWMGGGGGRSSSEQV